MQGRFLATAATAALIAGLWGATAQGQQVTISVPEATPPDLVNTNNAPTQINLGQINNVVAQSASVLNDQIGMLVPATQLLGDTVTVEENSIQAVFSANNAENSVLAAGTECIGDGCGGFIQPNTANIAASTAQVFFDSGVSISEFDGNLIGADFAGAVDDTENTSIKVDANSMLSRAAGNRLQQTFAGEFQTLDETGGGVQQVVINSAATDQVTVNDGGNITSAYNQLITDNTEVTGAIGNVGGNNTYGTQGFENFIGIINEDPGSIVDLAETMRVLNNSATAFAAGNDTNSSISGETGPHTSAIAGYQNATGAVTITALTENMGIGLISPSTGVITNSTTRVGGNVIAAIGAGNNAVNALGTGN